VLRYGGGIADTTRPQGVRWILIGQMGSGKSSVGQALAERTGWPFFDNDVLVERATGRTPRQLLAESGEASMRAAEAAALRHGLALEAPVIVALAAGTILDPEHRALASRSGFVAWLRAPVEVLTARAAGASHRPFVERDPSLWFARAAAERDALFAAIADVEVDTSRLAPAAAADAILAAATIGR
jgi:shikimate kinase